MAAFVDNLHRRPRQFRGTDVAYEFLDDNNLRKRYRFSSQNIDRLVRLTGHRLERPTKRNLPLTPRQQIMIALRFYATGNFLQVIGETFGVDAATVSRVITSVTEALFNIKDRVILFPVTDVARNTVKRGFFSMRGFPGVVGCIDGTQVRIISPPKDEEAAYVNRKHYHSINVQATVDHLGKFTSINASWPGSSHDSHVFRVSSLCQYLEAHHKGLEKGVLLGDSGYPCRPFLLTPYLNPSSASEERYNEAHTGTRNLIERVFGVWKRKFHVLHSEIRMKPKKVSRIIIACAVLHNLAIMWNEADDQVDDEDNDQPDQDTFNGPQDGRGIREHITRSFFS